MDEPKEILSRRTEHYSKWIDRLRDNKARSLILARVYRLLRGNPGDHKDFGDVSGMRIHYGPGYRVYYANEGDKIIILLAGGDKRRQSKDIETARKLLVLAREEMKEQ